MNKKTERATIWAFAALVVIFLFFWVIIGLDPFISAIAGAAGFVVGFLFFEKKKEEVVDQEKTLKDALDLGAKNLSQIRTLEKQIRKPTMVSQIKEIETIFEKILLDIKKNPAKLRNSKQFLDYDVSTTITVLSKYVEIASHNVNDPNIKKTLANVEAAVPTIRDAFEKQQAKVLSDDAMNLDSEIATLAQTINMDGLGKD
jgi:5-bromo-4-chloroindolyl phosphate hydrolysis protein